MICRSPIYILDANPLSDVLSVFSLSQLHASIFKIFSSYFLFIFEKFVILMRFSLSNFSFIISYLISKKSLPLGCAYNSFKNNFCYGMISLHLSNCSHVDAWKHFLFYIRLPDAFLKTNWPGLFLNFKLRHWFVCQVSCQ